MKAGQVIRLHSEYQNNSGAPERRDGHHGSLARVPGPRLPAPGRRHPVRASLVPAYNQCTSPNRMHGPPASRAAPTPRFLQPAGPDLEPDHGRHPGRERSGRELGRLGAHVGDQRQPGNHRRRGQRELHGVDHRRALQARRGSLRGRQRRGRRRLHRPGAGQDRACGSPTATTAPRRSARARTPRSRSRCRARPRPAPAWARPARSTRPPTR